MTVLPRLAATLTTLTLSLLFAGCTTAPEPTPTPTPEPTFTEEEAFALAEETFRAFHREQQKINFRDPKQFERLRPFTTHTRFLAEKKSLTNAFARGETLVGTPEIVWFRLHEMISSTELTARVCEDITDVDVIDEAGNSIVTAERPDLFASYLTFTYENNAFKISDSRAVKDPEC
ncbi:hypothetical protein [Microbacterium sp. YY-01]|uniref:hypothetical protein n=1 Tax=Microbacterium sp. YY-01 TaxID=3421634 RepID=UPI003D16D375